uniref:Uncharacterized protein n=1 Tax=Compsopogon caeruleus TaxID=31354 RepID=A0A7S1T6Z3_9RHOD|mmetsp:Transcript_11928/g.24297  ORF Transcript_11928/g.24297 Transcript_11928/m.24297 type:complete len:200 (+) Transcript_11928:25-624(+)
MNIEGWPLCVVDGWTTTEAVELTLKESLAFLRGDDYEVTKASGEVVFRVRGNVFSWRSHKEMVDMHGQVVAIMDRKLESILFTQRVFNARGELLFTVRRRNLLPWKLEMDIIVIREGRRVASGQKGVPPDFIVTGNTLTRDVTITRTHDREIVTRISRKGLIIGDILLGRDTYNVLIPPGSDIAFSILAAIAIDEIFRK